MTDRLSEALGKLKPAQVPPPKPAPKAPAQVIPEVEASTPSIRTQERELAKEKGVRLGKMIGGIAIGLGSLAGGGKLAWDTFVPKAPPAPAPVAQCPPDEKIPDEPREGVCQRLKRATAAAADAQRDAAECFARSVRIQRAVTLLEGDVSELEERVPKKRR